ncbi:MAG: trigger factor [Armatimonadota bacterium]
MQVNVEQLDPCKVQLTIEIDPETVTKTIDYVYREYSKVTAVPGFRKGKAPRHLLERFVSEESIKERSIESMVPDAYENAIKQESIEPYADPDIEIVQYEPGKSFIFKAIVPLPPKIELGEYKGIEVERKAVQITDEDVESQIKYLLESRATTEKVEDRGVQAGDMVIAEVTSAPEGDEKPEPKRSLIQAGQNVPGFDENIEGLKIGERKSFTVEYPADFSDESLAGKKVEFDISVETIRERHLPELNDEFVASLGQFETVDAMKEDIRSHLIKTAEETADRDVEQKIIDEIVSRSEVNFPDVLVEHEVHHDLEEMQNRLSQQNMNLTDYVKRTGKTPEQFMAELRDQASYRIKIGLSLGEIAEKENLEVTDEDIDNEIDRIAEESNATREAVETFIETRGGRNNVRNSLLNRKIMDYIKSVSNIKQ